MRWQKSSGTGDWDHEPGSPAWHPWQHAQRGEEKRAHIPLCPTHHRAFRVQSRGHEALNQRGGAALAPLGGTRAARHGRIPPAPPGWGRRGVDSDVMGKRANQIVIVLSKSRMMQPNRDSAER